MCALMHSLGTLTNTHSQCMYIKVSDHVLTTLTIPQDQLKSITFVSDLSADNILLLLI